MAYRQIANKNNPESYLYSGNPNISGKYITGSFFNRTLSERAEFVFSSSAMHWLSDASLKNPHYVCHQLETDTHRTIVVKDFSKKDWQTILNARAEELVPGGQAVLVNLAVNEEGDWITKNAMVEPSF